MSDASIYTKQSSKKLIKQQKKAKPLSELSDIWYAGYKEHPSWYAVKFGIPPKVLQSVSAHQLFTLVAARQALIDTGLYGKNAKPYENRQQYAGV